MATNESALSEAQRELETRGIEPQKTSFNSMPSGLGEAIAEAENRGIDISTGLPEQGVKSDIPPEIPGVGIPLLDPVNAIFNDPIGSSGAIIRGAQHAFSPSEAFLSQVEGSLNFLVIRGAELAAKMFVPDDMEAELTEYNDVVQESHALTKSLRDRAPGWVDGTELGIAIPAGIQLVKVATKYAVSKSISGVQKADLIITKGMQKLSAWRAGRAQKQVIKMSEKLLLEGKGPVLDAILKEPDEVLRILDEDPGLIDDMAVEVHDKLVNIQDDLGKAVAKHRKAFSADPLTKVDVSAPRQLMSQVKDATTSSKGISVLDSKQLKRLEILDELLTPATKQKAVGAVTQTVPQTAIPPKDALLAIDKIDEMINLNEIAKGNISAAAVDNLINLRRTLKAQIRGNNDAWAVADDMFASYKEASAGFISRLEKDSAESFINNLFGKNKYRQRLRLKKALDYADLSDTAIKGSGDAFFRRLSTIKAAQKIQQVRLDVTRPIQNVTNRIVGRWVAAGAGAGTALGTKLAGFAGSAPGAAIGGLAGFQVGRKMANPIRVLNRAIKAKNLSAESKALAKDMLFIHKHYGNDGLIAFTDVVESTPAIHTLTNWAAKFIL